MGIVTWFLWPEEIQSTLPNVRHSVLDEIIKVISYLEIEMETIGLE